TITSRMNYDQQRLTTKTRKHEMYMFGFVLSCFRDFVADGSSRLSKNAARRVAPRRAHDAAPRMRRRPAHPQIANGRRVLRPSGRRPQEEQLLERQLALKNVALCQPELALE